VARVLTENATRTTHFRGSVEVKTEMVERSCLILARPTRSLWPCGRSCPILWRQVIAASRNSTPGDESEADVESETAEEWPDVIGEAGDLPM